MRNDRMLSGEFDQRTPESQGVPSAALTACLHEIIGSGENVHALQVFKNGYYIGGDLPGPLRPSPPAGSIPLARAFGAQRFYRSDGQWENRNMAGITAIIPADDHDRRR